MSFQSIDIGLPFFDDINKQVRNQVYFTAPHADFICPENRFLPFQINSGAVSGIDIFDLVNSYTDATTDYLAHFNANVVFTLEDGEYIYRYFAYDTISISGKFYFHVVGTGGKEWWSEEFIVCGDITEPNEFLLISHSDYLLIGGTDRLIIG